MMSSMTLSVVNKLALIKHHRFILTDLNDAMVQSIEDLLLMNSQIQSEVIRINLSI